MTKSVIRFGDFRLDPTNRRLFHGDLPVDLNARYMDVLVLLATANGDLVSKDRFMREVWRGVPVTDEALTQAVRTLRRTLGDSAVAPKFIETVAKHGYRFIAPTGAREGPTNEDHPPQSTTRADFIRIAAAGSGGALLAGALIGLIYGFIGVAQLNTVGGGAASTVLVLILVSSLAAAVAGGGIAAGLAAAEFVRPLHPYWKVAGGALGGVIAGTFANAIGSDAFRLLIGQNISQFSGAGEGLILGTVIGLASSLSRERPARTMANILLLGAGAGLCVALLGGRMMAGSLDSLVSAFPSAKFGFGAVGSLLGEKGLGPTGGALTAAFEGGIFSLGVVWGSRKAGDRVRLPA